MSKKGTTKSKKKNNNISQTKISKLQLSNSIKNFYAMSNTILEGSKVKLNYNRIIKRKGYDDLVSEYKEFIELNKDSVFTVEYDKDRRDNPSWVCLVEDNTPFKWLFYVGDLVVLADPYIGDEELLEQMKEGHNE